MNTDEERITLSLNPVTIKKLEYIAAHMGMSLEEALPHLVEIGLEESEKQKKSGQEAMK